MGRKVRSGLAKTWGLWGAGAIILCVIRVIDTDLNPISAPVVVLTGLAVAGTILAQVQDKRDEHLIALARNLADVTRSPDPRQPTRAPLRRAQ